jgi:hypothetical protein
MHILQATWVVLFELFPSFEWTFYAMITMAVIILLLEMVQIGHDPADYFSNVFNYLEVTGNLLVIATRWDYFR